MTKEIDSTDLLKKAIRNSEAFEDGFCIVCGNHTDSHSPDCLMNAESNGKPVDSDGSNS